MGPLAYLIAVGTADQRGRWDVVDWLVLTVALLMPGFPLTARLCALVPQSLRRKRSLACELLMRLVLVRLEHLTQRALKEHSRNQNIKLADFFFMPLSEFYFMPLSFALT